MDDPIKQSVEKALYAMNLKAAISLHSALIAILTAAFFLPIVLGFWQTLLPSFGYLPVLDVSKFEFQAWQDLVTEPGFASSLSLTLFTGFASTVLASLLTFSICAMIQNRIGKFATEKLLATFLATPHAAVAIGLAFLFAPSGFFSRLITSWTTEWQQPPDIITINDDRGISLIITLIAKEVPFLLFVTLSALNHIPTQKFMAVGHALGYGRAQIWISIIIPQIYPLIRLSLFIVLAFSLSVIDMAIIVGPSNPPTLSVLSLQWFYDPDPLSLKLATAAAILQTLIIVGAVIIWHAMERIVTLAGRWWIRKGQRDNISDYLMRLLAALAVILLACSTLALISLIIWSVAWRWPFPDVTPLSWSLQSWTYVLNSKLNILFNSVVIAACTSLISLFFAIAWLEWPKFESPSIRIIVFGVIILPLFIPQIAFLFGLHILFLSSGFSASLISVCWAHSLFVFPYIILTLSDSWRSLDKRYIRSAASLGASRLKILARVKLPMLLRPLLISAAIGFSVSMGLYLPSLVIGEGRIPTVTTEAVALATGADRRLQSVYALLQALFPMIIFFAALLIPRIVYAERAYLRGVRL